MQFSSQAIARLVGPALRAVSRPSPERICVALECARESTRATREALTERGETVHTLSFELGAGTAFVEMLGTLEQRRILGDAISVARQAPRGTEILQLVAQLGESMAAATQGALADRMGIDRGNFNRYVRRLEDAGLIESQRASRRVQYRPLPLGLEVLKHLRPDWRTLDPQVLLHFDLPIQASAEGVTTGAAALGKERKEVSVSELLNAVTGSNAAFDGADMRRTVKISSRRSFGASIASTSKIEFLQEVA